MNQEIIEQYTDDDERLHTIYEKDGTTYHEVGTGYGDGYSRVKVVEVVA